jgi:hypothetical protein
LQNAIVAERAQAEKNVPGGRLAWVPGFTRFQDAIQPASLPHPHYDTLCKTSEGIYGTLDALLRLLEAKMISVQNVSPLGSDCDFAVDLLVDGKLQTYRLAVESMMVDGKVIERIICEDGLTRLLHISPSLARSFFRMVGNVYHGKKIEFPVDLDASEGGVMA